MKRHSLSTCFLSLFLASSSFALPQVGEMASQQQAAHQQRTVTQLVDLLNRSSKKPLNAKQLHQLVTNNIRISSNGDSKARGEQQALKFLQSQFAPNRHSHIQMNIDELIVAGNNVVAHYYLKQMINGKWQNHQVMANFTFDHKKITNWSEVSA